MVSVETPKRLANTPELSCERALSARTVGLVRAWGGMASNSGPFGANHGSCQSAKHAFQLTMAAGSTTIHYKKD